VDQKKGFAFFTFQRHGHGASSGEYIVDLQRRANIAHRFNRSAQQREGVSLQELYNTDVESAVAWLKEQRWVDVVANSAGSDAPRLALTARADQRLPSCITRSR
jgi:hypothetical protein